MNTDRRALRDWVRRNHPDVGGDPEAFALGLARLRGTMSRAPVDGRTHIEIHRAPRGPLGHLAEAVRRRRRRRARARRLR
ncbi:hypothetical protein GCM10027294_29490 [Marinactinospora endophytica]